MVSAALLALVGIGPVAIGIPSAHAGDREYLAMLKSWGYPVNDKTTDSLVTIGHALCTDLLAGTGKDDEAEALRKQAPDLSFAKARNMVTVAQRTLCPETLQP